MVVAVTDYLPVSKPPNGFLSALIGPAVYLGTCLELHMWVRFGRRLHSLMEGRSTVDGYFWRLLPVRAAYLEMIGVTVRYHGVDFPKWQHWVREAEADDDRRSRPQQHSTA